MNRRAIASFLVVAALFLPSLILATDFERGPLTVTADTVLIQSRLPEKDGGVPITRFLTPEGRIDLDAIRQSGYRGSFDLKGVNVGLDPTTGEPIAQVSTSMSPSVDPDDIYWDNSISPSIQGTGNTVISMTIYCGELIAGGYFTAAGGILANRIAAWDGSSWSPLGSGMNDRVIELTVYDNKLIAGGGFITDGNVSAG